MNQQNKSKWFAIGVFLLLAIGSLIFVSWIGQMSFRNTCIELQEEYIGIEVREEIDSIENSINFGKELDNFYGIDEILNNICLVSEGNLETVIINKEGTPIYNTMEESPEAITTLSHIYSKDYYEQALSVTDKDTLGEKIKLGNKNSLVFPIYHNEEELVGHVLVIYDQNSLVSSDIADLGNSKKAMLGIWLIVAVLLICFEFFLSPKADEKKWYVRYMPVILIMTGMLCFILNLYSVYEQKYNVMIEQNAESAAEYIQKAVRRLEEKGLKLNNIDEVSEYINGKVKDNQAIGSISVVNSYYDTSESIENVDSTIIVLPLREQGCYVNISVSRTFIDKQIRLMTLTFGAIFIICLMITYELTHMAEVISARLSKDFGQESPYQMNGIGTQIKLLSFLTYTALYTSMPYAAVIMRNWNASVWGLSESVSASLPLTIELLCVMICSLLIQKFFKDSKMQHLTIILFPILILGNLACMRVSSPYILIALRAFCGIGFAFLKYWLNAYVAAGSANEKEVQRNYAQLNAGLLGGITVGASLGSILAQSFGYQFNYLFTAIVCGVVLIFAIIFIPWKMLNGRREQAVESARKSSVPFKELLQNKSVLFAIILGDIPLNIGLMYVVSFLPVYMSSVGQPAVVTSYAYLINGIAGVYIGVVLIAILKGVSTKVGSVIALGMASVGILILVLGSNAGVILLSAGILGLFDGYGTPTITSFFTGLPAVQKADTASMLTLFNSVGSAVQIICPILYNVLIQPDGKTTYLFFFGIAFLVVTVVFMLVFGCNSEKKVGNCR